MRKVFKSGVMAIYALWAFGFIVIGAVIQSGGLAYVNEKVWLTGGFTFLVVLIITAVVILRKERDDA